MKREEMYKFMYESCHGKEGGTEFGFTYKKKDGTVRVAKGKLYSPEVVVKGTGMNRDQKMEKNKVFQYFDLNSNAYRSAKLENILDITVNGEKYLIED